MNTSTKINLLILPLFVSILLSVTSNLKIGRTIDNIFHTILSPITFPAGKLRLSLQKQVIYIKSISTLEKDNRNQKIEIARLLSENEYFKQAIVDKEILQKTNHISGEIVPVRLSGATDKYIVTSTSPLTKVKPGQPLISNNILLGTVVEVKGNVATVTPLDSQKAPIFSVRTSSNQKGTYHFDNNHSLLTDVPSQFPLVLGDTIFTEPDEIFPGNLVVGKIVKIITISQEPLQKAEIQLFDSLSNHPEDLAIIVAPK